MEKHPYIIDTSSLTQAHRGHYPFDIFISFWNFIRDRILVGDIILTERVLSEIKRGKDALLDWVENEIPSGLIMEITSDENILNQYGTLMQWSISQPQFLPIAISDFADFDNADPWIVATALSINGIVVSQAVSAPDSRRNIKIPDVCNQFQVRHISTIDLLRELGFSN